MSKYYICSIGQPGRGYDDENLRRCIIESAYCLHEECVQKGPIDQIQVDDVLILKYQDHFLAYGRVSEAMKIEGVSGWNIKVPVEGWISGKPTYKAGIQSAQIDGNNYQAVRQVEREFARRKTREIGVPF